MPTAFWLHLTVIPRPFASPGLIHGMALLLRERLWLPVLLLLAAHVGHGQTFGLHPDNPRYFLWRNQPTLIITSGEHYGAVLNLDFDYRRYLDTLARDRLNGTRTWAGAYAETGGNFNIAANTLDPAPGRFICPWARSATPGYADGGNKFDLTRWDPAYFDRLKSFVAYASRRGVVVELNLFCPMYEESMWSVCPLNAANNINNLGRIGRNDVLTLDRNGGLLPIQEAMVRKIVGELRDADNVYYEVCNEPYATGVPLDWQLHIAAVIADAQRPHPQPKLISLNIANQSARVPAPYPNISLYNFHYATPPDVVAQNAHLNRPIGDNETGFRGTADTAYRTEAWDFILAGGALFNHLDYSFTVGHEDGTFRYPASQPGGGNPTLRKQFRTLRDFIHRFDFIHMRPDNSIVRAGAPAGGSARALVHQDGSSAAIYLRRGAATGPFSVRWTGFVTPAAAGDYVFHTFSNDGVRLWIDDRLIIDQWVDQSEKEHQGRASLQAGRPHAIKLEYFYNGGQGAAKLWWSTAGSPAVPIPTQALTPPDRNGQGLLGHYFRGNQFQEPWNQRLDPAVNFAWGTESPFPRSTDTATQPLTLLLEAGSWRIRWLDPVSGQTPSRTRISHRGGPLDLPVPHFTDDIALELRKS